MSIFKIKTEVGNYVSVRGDGRVRLVDEDYADTYATKRDAEKCIKRLVDWCGYETNDLKIVRA